MKAFTGVLWLFWSNSFKYGEVFLASHSVLGSIEYSYELKIFALLTFLNTLLFRHDFVILGGFKQFDPILRFLWYKMLILWALTLRNWKRILDPLNN